MFQTFDATTSPEQGPPRLASLRNLMDGDGLDAVLVPRTDAFQGEYVAPCDARLAWLTGFTGSAGFAVVLADSAGLFVDGRYRVQARAQCAAEIEIVPWPENRLADWLKERLTAPAVIGYDPWLHTKAEISDLADALPNGFELRPVGNPVDLIWNDRPPPPHAPFRVHDAALAGETSESKRTRLGKELAKAGETAAILTLPDSIAWLLNIRGRDIPHNPVPHAFAVLHSSGEVDLFAAKAQVAPVAKMLGPEVHLLDRDAFLSRITSLTGPVRVGGASAPQIVTTTLTDAGIEVRDGRDPCVLPKATKTGAELDGARAAHLRDGVAMVRFLAWVDDAAERVEAGETVTEIDACKALEAFRVETGELRDTSFETISGSGPNGAIVHYRVTEDTNRALAMGDLLLIDSGGQYPDGTTDITRTMPIGPVGIEESEMYTRVLMGVIAISRARFPKGVEGRNLDALARTPLWSIGRDYDHGTGHGVGSYLCVHEGPQGLSRRSGEPLLPGMILSNEPGYYKEGAFGIRIENLIVVREAPAIAGADPREMLGFETLTHVPFDRRLIDANLLSEADRGWIDTYHADTLRKLAPQLENHPAALAWLRAATAPL